MLRHCIASIAAAIAIGFYISASALAGHVGFGNSGGPHGGGGFGGTSASGRFNNRGGEIRRPAGRIDGRFSRRFGIALYPPAIIEAPYLDFEDYESSCGFYWTDLIFNQRLIRQRLYTCP
jgi:hypothetical protein